MTISDELGKLAKLKDQGALTKAEFELAKTRVLSGISSGSKTVETSAGSGGIKVFLLLMLGLVVMYFGIDLYQSKTDFGKAKRRARAAIELCWDDYKISRVPLDQRRLMAETCERMTFHFKEKYDSAP